MSVDNDAQADGLLYRFRNNGELVNSLQSLEKKKEKKKKKDLAYIPVHKSDN